MKIDVKDIISKKGNMYKEITLTNDNNMLVKCIDLGCVITEIIVPDKDDNFENVVIAYEDYDHYLKNPAYLGAVIGRNSGRIGDGIIEINGTRVELNKNDGNNTLHGGYNGLNFRKFDVEVIEGNNYVGVEFKYKSLDKEENFPGELDVVVTYTLNNKNELKINYNGKANEDTILNMTNHTYFNLSGHCKRKVTEQNLYINSSAFTELDEESIITGKMLNVENTPFDFRKSKKIGQDINEEFYQLQITKGYDHYFRLDKNNDISVELFDELSGRSLEIETECNGVVVYSGNYISDGMLSIGRNVDFRDGICLETQNIPVGRKNQFVEDSLLLKGEVYEKSTIYRFKTK